MQLTITLAEILNYLFGSTTLVTIYIAWKSRKSTLKQAESTALEGIDSIYKKMVDATEKKFGEMQQTITDLESKLDGYINQCSNCENNKLTKKR